MVELLTLWTMLVVLLAPVVLAVGVPLYIVCRMVKWMFS